MWCDTRTTGGRRVTDCWYASTLKFYIWFPKITAPMYTLNSWFINLREIGVPCWTGIVSSLWRSLSHHKGHCFAGIIMAVSGECEQICEYAIIVREPFLTFGHGHERPQEGARGETCPPRGILKFYMFILFLICSSKVYRKASWLTLHESNNIVCVS